MASILRSSKFVRVFAGFPKNLGIIPQTEIEHTLKKQCLCNQLPRFFASQLPNPGIPDQILDKSIRRLDQDVRRSGRVSRRDIEEIMGEMIHSQVASSSQSLMVIRCCGSLVPEELPEKRTKLVQEIWKILQSLNVPMDISHYNALLRVYLENEYPFSPTDFLAELESKGIEPNRVTYQRLIARYCQEGDIEGATKILEFMKEKQLPVNENVFNALIMGHSRSGDMDSAKGILNVMQQAGMPPSADTYTTLLCGYARQGDTESIKNILKECEAKDVFLLDKDYMDIIFELAVNNHHDLIPELLSKMRKSVGYNQDAVNLILKLINCGQDNVAIDVLNTMPQSQKSSGEPPNVGAFFIKQLIKVKRPVEKVLSFCKYLQNEGLNPNALLLAADFSIKETNPDFVYPILKELKDNGLEIRQHYFWPLIAAQGMQKNVEGVLNVLNTMKSEFDLSVGTETLKDYVYKHLNETKSDKIIDMLKTVNVSVASAASSLVHYWLTKDNIKEAASVACRYRAYYPQAQLRRVLAIAYIKTKDIDSFINIVRRIHDCTDRRNNVFGNEEKDEDESEENSDAELAKNAVGQLIFEVMVADSQNAAQNITDILNKLVEQGLSIHSRAAERIQNYLNERLTSEISSLLNKLTSGELKPIPVVRKIAQIDSDRMERTVKILESKGEDTLGLKRQLFALYCRENNVEKAEALFEDLKNNEKFELNGGIYAQLIDIYASSDNLEKALECKQELKNLDPSSGLDNAKIIKLATLLAKHNRYDEVIELLTEKPRRKMEETTFVYNGLCWKLLNTIAEQGKADEVNKIFDVLVSEDYIAPNNVLLGPLIKVHIVNNDIEKALEKFEWCCNKYRATPWKSELANRFIQKEDAVNLQKLTDLSTSIHGEVNSLYDLVFSFIDSGRIRQAKKILETPGLRNRQQRINNASERYAKEGESNKLEGLVEATKDINYLDRSEIYYYLLVSYIKQNDRDNALGLWTRLQEDDIQPSDRFLHTLGNYLKSCNENVPFVIPERVVELAPTIKPKFGDVVKTDINRAMRLKNKLGEGKLGLTNRSLLIEALVKDDRLNEAKSEILKLFDEGKHPIPRVLKFFILKLSLAGDIDSLKEIEEKLTPVLKKEISFDNTLCNAYTIAGKAEEYLSQLEKELENAKTESETKSVEEKFPRGGLLGVIEKYPELVNKVEHVVKVYGERGILSPANTLWMYYFAQNNEEAAGNLWSTYLKESPRIMFHYIVNKARKENDEQLIIRLLNTMKNSKVGEGGVGNVYSCLLDIQTSNNQFDEALKTLELALKDVCLENINSSALKRIKNGLEQEGKTFPYEIPAKKAKSSSSSSSDDEKRNLA